MTEISGPENTTEQEFSMEAPVLDLVACVDYFLNQHGLSSSSFRNPSAENESSEKVAGMTNIYLKPTRIGRKAVLGDAFFFYGRKFDLLPEAYEIVSYDAPADVFSFVKNRIRETLTDYLKRVERLQEIATSVEGVNKSYAIQAGREVRIIVKPEEVNDEVCAQISRDLAKKIEGELTYPGQIKVTVIRESRYVEYAK